MRSMSSGRVRRKTVGAWRIIKAPLVGLCVCYYLAIIVAAAATPFMGVLAMGHYPAVLFVSNGCDSLVPWLTFLVIGAVMTVGGYVAASLAPSRKLLAGIALAALLFLLPVLSLVVTRVQDPKDLVAAFTLIVALLIFPTLGAYAEKAWFHCKEPLRFGRLAWLGTAYAALPVGLLMAVGTVVVLAFYRTWGEVTTQGYVAGALFVCVGASGALYAIWTFVKIRGAKRGLARNWYVWGTVAAMAVFTVGFIRRDHSNRPDPNYLEHLEERLDADFAYPDETNGAILYMQAASQMPHREGAPSYPQNLRRLEDDPGYARLLAGKDDALRLALRASRRPVVRFPYRLEAYQADCDFEKIRGLAEALGAKGLLCAAEDDIAEAFGYLEAAFKMGSALSVQGGFRLHAGVGHCSIAVRAVREILKEPDLSKDELRMIAAKLAEWDALEAPSQEEWARSATPSYSDGVEWLDQMFADLRAKSIRSYAASQLVSKQAMLDIQNRVTGEILAAPNWLAMMHRGEREQDMGVDLMYTSWSAPLKGSATRMLEGIARGMVPQFIWSEIQSLLDHRGRIRLLRVYAATYMFKLENDALPHSWEDLVPEYLPLIPQDPFSERPLMLRVASEGLVMYSVGDDCEDDGGEIPVVNQAKAEADGEDLFFNYRGWTGDMVLLFPAE